MKPLIDFFNQNIDNKLLFSKEDIFKKKGMFSLSPFGDVYLKGISELLGQNNTLFGLGKNIESIHFCDDFFILRHNLTYKKLDYRTFRDLTVIPKVTVLGSGKWMYNDTELMNHFGTKPKFDEFFSLFNKIKSVIKTIEFDESTDVEKMTKKRKTSLTGLTNIFEKYKEKEMDPWEIKEIQNEFSLEIVDLNNLTTLISTLEKEILEKEKGQEYLQKFIRLKRYVSQIRDGLISDLVMGRHGHWKFKKSLLVHLDKLKKNNEQLELLNNISNYLIRNFVNDKMIDFYEIYENLDKLGIFNSNYENRIIEELGSINDGLRKINNKLTYLNVLTTYNTYQLSKIRKG